MGLFTAVLTLPLTPVRSVAWLAEHILEQAEEQMYDPAAVRRQLTVIETEKERGHLSDDEAADLEDELLGRMMAHRPGGPEGDRAFP